MRRILFITLSFLLLSACTSKDEYQMGQKTKMEINTNINAGEVFLGEKVKTDIKIKNVGSYPLILAEVVGSCSCTIAEYPKDPIPPGQTAVIKTSIATSSIGRLTKDIRISSNTEPSLTKVIITADVVDRN